MTILLDHCLPKRLRRFLPGYTVTTAREMRWEEIRNGELLALAEKQFEVFLTIDKGIKYQQNMTGRTIAVITLRAKSNQIEALAPLMTQVLDLLPTAQPGQVYLIEAKREGQASQENDATE
jgi:predicted nuclease of predicted toxin-antitoxin system